MRKIIETSLEAILSISILSVVLIIIVIRMHYGSWNPFRPDRVEYFGRTYYNASKHNDTIDLSNKEPKYKIQQTLFDALTKNQFYMDSPKGEDVPDDIYLHVNDEKYYMFYLSGGH